MSAKNSVSSAAIMTSKVPIVQGYGWWDDSARAVIPLRTKQNLQIVRASWQANDEHRYARIFLVGGRRGHIGVEPCRGRGREGGSIWRI